MCLDVKNILQLDNLIKHVLFCICMEGLCNSALDGCCFVILIHIVEILLDYSEEW